MEATELLKALHTAGALRDALRHCYTPGGRRESVAEHSWRLALMAYWIKDEFPDADMDKVIRMCLIHDLGEAFTGDIPVFLKTEADEAREEDLLLSWVSSLPEPIRGEMTGLYGEMVALETEEARIYKALDGLEAVIAHNESDIGTWEDHEYELNRHYAADRAAFSPFLRELRRVLREETDRKIEREGREKA